MNHKERMLANLPYQAWQDGLEAERTENKKRIYAYNHLPPAQWDQQDGLLRAILGKAGGNLHIEPPFHCDYGYNIEVGESFYANYNLIILDVAHVRIGDNALLGPNVAIYTAGHPLDSEMRRRGWEYGIDITIGDDVWIGGNTVILPGVHIGSRVVIGGGSVVTKDIPDDTLAYGNPCRVVRPITEADRAFYFRDRPFPAEQ